MAVLSVTIALYFISALFQDVGVNKGTESVAQSVDELAVNIWLEKAEVFMNMGLYEPARHFLAEAHRVSVVSRSLWLKKFR